VRANWALAFWAAVGSNPGVRLLTSPFFVSTLNTSCTLLAPAHPSQADESFSLQQWLPDVEKEVQAFEIAIVENVVLCPGRGCRPRPTTTVLRGAEVYLTIDCQGWSGRGNDGEKGDQRRSPSGDQASILRMLLGW
jgi:hypothetical protein